MWKNLSCIKKVEVKNNPVSYACYNKNEEVRKNSSSGRIFTLLAEYILEKNEIIYGHHSSMTSL